MIKSPVKKRKKQGGVEEMMDVLSKISIRALKWPDDVTKQKSILNAALERSAWEYCCDMLDFITELSEKYREQWTDSERKKYDALKTRSKKLFRRTDSEQHIQYEPPHIIDGILTEDNRIIRMIDFHNTGKADENIIFR